MSACRAVLVFTCCVFCSFNISAYAAPPHYVMCMGCHSPSYNRTGPKHCGVFGQLAARQEGFQYSEALTMSRLRWDRQTLDKFLESPAAMVPGTSMTFAGITDANVRTQLIDYIELLTTDHNDCR
ncbi:c-type cytochrome [Neptunomonas japonica]|uniref:Cytochrome c n=1 Tax=Neptunomonas japonica JAMM 1380 TaxID=1441457 RepID=A0A7R6PB72_9GAMM|nr:hypothetical protein [Neptunomonas japonica]BBB29259.1 cytochrome c [Neptunomonas japonica JAMM 1380]